MIELTPLDVRNKNEDLDRAWRGYSMVQVESFLDLAAERLEELVTEKKRLEERVERPSSSVERGESAGPAWADSANEGSE